MKINTEIHVIFKVYTSRIKKTEVFHSTDKHSGLVFWTCPLCFFSQEILRFTQDDRALLRMTAK